MIPQNWVSHTALRDIFSINGLTLILKVWCRTNNYNYFKVHPVFNDNDVMLQYFCIFFFFRLVFVGNSWRLSWRICQNNYQYSIINLHVLWWWNYTKFCTNIEKKFFVILKFGLVWLMLFNTNFNNIPVISWWSALLVEETGVSEENHRPVASHWQTLSHIVSCLNV
jgi:hypothetical protein